MSDLKTIANAASAARNVLTSIRDGIAWFRERGVLREQLITKLDELEAEGRDFTDIEYAEMAGDAQDAIDRLMAASAAAEPAPAPEPAPEPAPAAVDDEDADK